MVVGNDKMPGTAMSSWDDGKRNFNHGKKMLLNRKPGQDEGRGISVGQNKT